MISRFGREAELLGYRRVIVNISGCQLYYRSEAEQLTALVFLSVRPAENSGWTRSRRSWSRSESALR